MRKLVYACLPTLGLLFGLEALVRALNPAVSLIVHPGQVNCLQRSALLGQEFRPNCRAVMTEKVFETNDLGLRDARTGDDRATRILALGDSCTFGWGVEQEEAYPQLLQAKLDRAVGPHRYRVINAGVPGYTSYQGLLYFRERGVALGASIVIIGYGFNDIFRTGDVEQGLRWQRTFMPFLLLDDVLLDRSRMWLWLRSTLNKPPPTNLPFRSTAAQYQRNLTEMVQLARAHGAKPLLLDFWHPDSPEREHVAVPAEVARALDVPRVTYAGPRFDVVHPTRDGYVELTAQIFQRLQDAGYLTP